MTRDSRAGPASWLWPPVAAVALSAQAHTPRAGSASPATAGWLLGPWELAVVILLASTAWLYAAGLVALWRRGGKGSGIRAWRAGSYAAGWLALAIALVSPLDTLGSRLFSAHMVQHEVLMLIAAPLLVLGHPLAVYLWAVPVRWRSRVVAGVRRRSLRAFWRAITTPPVAWGLAATVLWVWHLPALFNATLRSDAIHALQHGCFLLSALVFWHVFLPRRGSRTRGAAILYIFTTALHSSVLGALLTFAPSVWYAGYHGRALAFGLTPLEDQQLGGLIMWVPAGAAYLAVALCWVAELTRDPKPATGASRDRSAVAHPTLALAGELFPRHGAPFDRAHPRIGSDG
jgi:putative membrane protein